MADNHKVVLEKSRELSEVMRSQGAIVGLKSLVANIEKVYLEEKGLKDERYDKQSAGY